MALELTNPGFLSLIQDYGRYGLQRQGITQGGPLDEHAYLWANRLLNNHYNAAQIEISVGGFVARFTRATMIAICGADLSASLNGQALAVWQSHYVKAGDELRFASPKRGLRAYLAVKGGFSIAPHLGSCATVLREKLGGLHQNGAALAKKDSLPYQECEQELSVQVPRNFLPDYFTASDKNEIQLRFMPNHSITGSSDKIINDFIQQNYKVTSQIDRMGYRLEHLEGKALTTSSKGIISQGLALGTIQLPKDGQPIVLMRDRQTMGGYPQLGCVAYLDLALLAQSKPGTKIKFIATAIDELEGELAEHKRFFDVDC